MQRVTKLWIILVIVILISISISGCSLFTEVVKEPYPVYNKIECQESPKIKGVNPQEVIPYVVPSGDGSNHWVAFTPLGYQNLSLNTQDTIRYIRDQKGVIRLYRDCIFDFNDEIEELENESNQ